MRVLFILIGLMIFLQNHVKAERWIDGLVELKSGDTLKAEIRNQKYFSEKLVCRVSGEKVRYGVEDIKSFQVGEELWKRIELVDLDGQLVFARVEIRGTLFEAKITEVKCTCDDSYQSRKVWIWESDNELFVFKKRHFTGGLINWDQLKKKIARQLKLNDDSLPEKLKFDEVPEFVSRLG